MRKKAFSLLALACILATNVFPTVPSIPSIVVQATTSQENQDKATNNEVSEQTVTSDMPEIKKDTEKSTGLTTSSNENNIIQKTEETLESQEATVETNPSNEKEDVPNEETTSGTTQTTEEVAKKKETTLSNDSIGMTDKNTYVVTGTWGMAPYSFDETTGILTIQAGMLGENSESPWERGQVTSSAIKKIELVGNVIAPVNSGYLFSSKDNSKWLSNLSEISGELDVSKTTSLYAMFWNCSKLTSVDVSDWDTSKVTNMQGVFNTCSSLKTIDVNMWDTSQVTDMSWMFSECNKLAEIDITNFSMSLVKDLTGMFKNCSEIKEIDLSNWTTSQVEYINEMFMGCKSLETLDLSHLTVESVIGMNDTFNGCSNLQKLNVSSWDTSKVTNMNQTFKDCTSLSELTLGVKSLFKEVAALPDGKWIGKTTGANYHTSVDFLNSYDGSVPDTYLRVTEIRYWGTSPYTLEDNTLTVYPGTLEAMGGTPWYKREVSTRYIEKIVFVGHVIAPENSAYLFSANKEQVEGDPFFTLQLKWLKEISGELDVSHVTNFYSAFLNCESLKEIDVSKWDTSSVTSMVSMFKGCNSLKKIILGPKSIFNGDTELPDAPWVGKETQITYTDSTSFLENYDGSFPDTFVRHGYWGTSLYSFDEATGTMTVQSGEIKGKVSAYDDSPASPWKAGEVSASDILKIELVGKVTVRAYASCYLFSGLRNLKSIKGIENLDTSSMISFEGMFLYCESLTEIDVSGFDMRQAIILTSMFEDCKSLRTLDLSSWQTGKLIDCSRMFQNAESLTNIIFGKWDTRQMEQFSKMFNGCSSLKKVDLSSFETSQATNFSWMFNGCTNLTELDISSLNTSKGQNFDSMFAGLDHLTELTLGPDSIFDMSTGMPSKMCDGVWIGKNTHEKYLDIPDLFTRYDGSQPDTFVKTTVKYWGTSPYTFDNESGALTIYPGTLGVSGESPWNAGDIVSTAIKKISIAGASVGDVILPANSQYLFSSSVKEHRLTNLEEIDGKLNTSKVANLFGLLQDSANLKRIDASEWDTSQVTNFTNGFNGCLHLTEIDLTNWDISKAVGINGLFANCPSLSKLTLGSKFNSVGRGDLGLPEHSWIGTTNLLHFETTVALISNYDGSNPDTYIWSDTPHLNLKVDNHQPMEIGKSDKLSWTIAHTQLSKQEQMAKTIMGKLSTSETVDLDANILVEKQDTFGNLVSITTVPLTYDGIIDNQATYSYVLPDLAYGYRYKLSLETTPWDNTTVSSSPTFQYDLDYIVDIKNQNTQTGLSESLSVSDNRIIENGKLSFETVPEKLEFMTTKLTDHASSQLISRQEIDWGIKVTDFRGTKAQSTTNIEPARQDWEIVATADTFKDPTGRELGYDVLSISYVDDQEKVNELSTTETLVTNHQVAGETPKNANDHMLSWTENRGFQAVIHDRNAVQPNKTYQAELTFELRSAP